MEQKKKSILDTVSSIVINFVSSNPIIEIAKQLSELKSNVYIGSGIREFAERQKKLAEELKDLKYEEYDEYFKNKITTARTLGKFGWVVSPHMSLGNETRMAKSLLDGVEEKKFTKIFFYNKNILNSIIEEIEKKYQKYGNLSMYMKNFKNVFKKRDYTSAAFYLSSILDYRLKQLFTHENMRRYQAVIKVGINEKRKKYFEKSKKNKENITNIFVLTEFLPSFQEYAERTFMEKDGFRIGEKEPLYFNRNWLMHGHSTKQVERYQTLQLLNALSSLEAILENFEKYNLIIKDNM